MTNTPKQNAAAVCELLPFHLVLFDPFLLHVLGFGASVGLRSYKRSTEGLSQETLRFKRQRVSTN